MPVINDMEAFYEAAYNDEKGIKDFAELMILRGEKHMIYFFACIGVSDLKGEWGSKPLIRRFIEHKQGVHLGGEIDSTQHIFTFDDVFGLERGKSLPAGMGHTTINGLTKRLAAVRH